MRKIIYIILTTTLFIFSCKQRNTPDAATIVNKSIEVSGGHLFDNLTIEFDFRDKHYKAIRNNGKFQYERVFSDSLGIIKDVLYNKGFQRYINEIPVEVSDNKSKEYSSSVNSVHYFSVLPYGLNAPAVNKFYLGNVDVKGENYHKLKVTFNEKGGGEDFDDVFVYWIHTETNKVEYLAYSYSEEDGIGFRFREAYNERNINTLRFVDYNNYKPKTKNVTLENLDNLFEKGDLDFLSKIVLENVTVTF